MTCRKKVRALALRHALSAKAKDGRADRLVRRHARRGQDQAAARKRSPRCALDNALIIDGAEVNENFALAARNLPQVDVLPVQGINVYDIMRRDKLVLTKAAVEALEARFK